MRRRRGSGTIERTAEGRYRARFPFADGREDLGVFGTRDDAARALDSFLLELHAAGADPRGGVTLRKLGERCLDQRERDGYRSIRSTRNLWKNHVEDWIASLGGMAAQSRRNALNLVRAVLETGVDRELLSENVARGIKVKDHGRSSFGSTFLSADEAARLLDAATDPIVAVALFTGLRQGELRSLEWADVHADHLVVRWGAPGKPTKGGKPREVSLTPQARAALAIVPRLGRLVFPSTTGEHRAAGWQVNRHDWAQWLIDAGIERRVRWHDLRHSCATLLLSGAWGHAWSKAAVQELLGHASITTTERYAKLLGNLSREAAQGIRLNPRS